MRWAVALRPGWELALVGLWVSVAPAPAAITFTETARLTGEGNANDLFGLSVAISGDVIVVGAPGCNRGRGTAFVFTRPSGGWGNPTPVAQLFASDQAFAFGEGVAIDGDTIVVGTRQGNVAYVYERPPAGWASGTETTPLSVSGLSSRDNFGSAVALAGEVALVSAADEDQRGAAYYLERPPSGWAGADARARLVASQREMSAFGRFAVATSGRIFVVGDPWIDTSSGAIYIYEIVDLELSASDLVDPVLAGSGSGNLAHTLTVTNPGPSIASSLVLDASASLPPGVTIDAIVPGAASSYTAIDATTGSWSVPSLPVGSAESLNITYTVTAAAIDGTAPEHAVAVVAVRASNLGDTAVTESTTVSSAVQQIELELIKSESVDPVLASSAPAALVYTIEVSNRGPSTATGLLFDESLTLPAGVTLDTITASGATTYTPSRDPAAGTWTIPTLLAGATETLTVSLQVDPSTAPATDSIADTLTLLASDQPNVGDTTVTERTSVNPEAHLVIETAESVDPAVAGSGRGNFTYVVSVRNDGPFAASGLELTQGLSLPAGTLLESVVPSGGTTFSDPVWTVGTLAVGGSASLTIEVTVGAATAGGFDRIAATTTVSRLGSFNSGDVSSTALTSVDVPFEPLPPFGVWVHRKVIGGGAIANPGEEVSWSFHLDEGQTLTLIATPELAGLRPSLRLEDGTGQIASVASPAGGQPAVLQSAPIAAGTYTAFVGGSSSSTGGFSLEAILNAEVEAEAHGGPSNDTVATAQDLDASLLPLLSAADGGLRGAVVGSATGVTHDAEGFESGSLGAAWTTASSESGGSIQVRSAPFGLASGTYALWLDRGAAGPETLNEAIWTVDLSGKERVVLHFAHAEAADEEAPFAGDFTGSFPADGIAISDDGVRWHPVFTPSDQPSFVWIRHTVDLTAAARAAGLVTGSQFRIKFQQLGTGPLFDDGRGWDDIAIVSREVDTYSLTLAAGDATTLAAAGHDGVAVDLELFDAAGNRLASGSPAGAELSRALRDFVAPATGDYFARVMTDSSRYVLSAIRRATLDVEPNDPQGAAQPLGADGLAVGYLGRSMFTVLVPFDEIVEIDPRTGTALGFLPTGLPARSFFVGLATTETTVLVGGLNQSILELDPHSGATLRSIPIPPALGGFGAASALAYLDGEIFATNPLAGNRTLFVFDGAGSLARTLTPIPGLWALTAAGGRLLALGSGSSTVPLYDVEPQIGTATLLRQLDLDYLAVGLGAIGNELFVARDNFIEVLDLETLTPLRRLTDLSNLTAIGADGAGIGQADVYRFDAFAGETLRLATRTPFSAAAEPDNNLDPRLELYDPSGALVAADDNGAGDGRNAALVHVAGSTGSYRARVLAAAGLGPYLLAGPLVDLALEIVESGDPAIAGSAPGNLQYLVTLRNDGPSLASGIELATLLTLPTNVSVDAIVPSLGTFSGAIWSLAGLPPGSQATLTVTITVGSAATAGSDLVGLTVNLDQVAEPATGDMAASATTSISRGSGLQLTKTDARDIAHPGEAITYTITVSESGPSDLLGATVSDSFAPALVAPSWTCAAVGSATCSAGPISGNLIDTVDLAAGSSLTYTVAATVAPGFVGELVNTVTVSAGTETAIAADQTLVTSPAVLIGTKTVSGDFVAGGEITYSVVLFNASPHAQLENPGAELIDTLPPTLELLAADILAGGGSLQIATEDRTVSWSGELAGGGELVLSISARIRLGTQGQRILNQARIHYDADGDGLNEAETLTSDPAGEGLEEPTAFIVAGPVPIPTLKTELLVLLSLLLLLAGLILSRRRG